MKTIITSAILFMGALCGYAAEPAAPTDLVAVNHLYNTLTPNDDIELSWTLPTTYADGRPFEAGVKVEAVKILRNNSQVALLEGEVTNFSEDSSAPDYGRSAYQVLAQVGGEWSAPSVPALVDLGEMEIEECIPWKPEVIGGVEYPWYCSYYNACKESSVGLTFEYDGWLASEYPIYFKPMRKYVLEYEISSKYEARYSISLVNSPIVNVKNLDVLQNLVATTKAPVKAERKSVEFVYEPKYNGYPYWTAYPHFAIECDNEAVLSYLSITEYDSASLWLPVADEAGDSGVYNLQGVYLGRSADGSLEGYAPGMYILRTAGGSARKVLLKP